VFEAFGREKVKPLRFGIDNNRQIHSDLVSVYGSNMPPVGVFDMFEDDFFGIERMGLIVTLRGGEP